MSIASIAHASSRIVSIDPLTDQRWERFVSAHPDKLVFHHPAWLRVLEEAFDYKPVHLAYEDGDGQLQGVLPLFALHGVVTGHRFSSLPRTPLAGPLTNDAESASALLSAAVERVRAVPGAQLQFKLASDTLSGLVEDVVGARWRQSYQIDLPERPEQLRFGGGRNQARLRWAIKKAAQLGVVVREAESEADLRKWYAIYLDTMRWYVVPPRPYHFFELIWRELRSRGMLQLLVAERHTAGGTDLLAGSLFLMYGKTVFYTFNGRRREGLTYRPNDALQWEAIHKACEGSYQYYDLGEVTSDHSSLADFKSKWGATPYWLYRYYYPAPSEVEIGILESQSWAGNLLHTTWKHLPLSATVVLSDWAHRHF
ncbi:MAG: lipid II:glycine glycyltransferase FemX [Ktedonobacterales bacterium]